MEGQYDFSGWATRNDLLCADGRTIRRGAFSSQNGSKVPLVWQHQHNSPDNVLGHAILEDRDEGVYAYCKFNNSEFGQKAKEIVKHGDVDSLSIYANNLKQSRNGDVFHGIIRELSLVLAGANPGAYIDTVLEHGDDSEDGIEVNYDERITIYEDEELEHSAEENQEEETKPEENSTESSEEDLTHSEDGNWNPFDEVKKMNEQQKKAVDFLVGMALEEGTKNNAIV